MTRGAWWKGVRQFLNAAGRRGRRGPRRARCDRPTFDLLEARLAPTVTLAVSDPAPFPKPDSGRLTGLFVVTRSGDLASAVDVNYATQDGAGPHGAQAGVDYLATAGTLIFAPNQTTATIAVPILGNNVFQADKTFTVRLSDPVPGVTFGPRQAFATGRFPTTIAVADWNGDGGPDLAVTNASDATVSVLLNTTPAGSAAPRFAPQQTFAVGTEPHGVAVADLNGDGRPDLAVVNNLSGTVSVLLNTTAPGATTAGFAPQRAFAVGPAPSAVSVADLNGDGRPDLVVANILDGTASVLLNTTPVGATAAGFAPQQTFAAGRDAQAIAAGDVNGDGRADLAVVNYHSDTVSVLLNTTAPGSTTTSFTAPRAFAVGNEPQSVVVADFDGDGRPDLAVANADPNTVSVLLNTTAPGAATPAFATQQTFATGGRGSASVTVGDVNGDGRPDLAVVNDLTAGVVVLLNTAAPGATTPGFAAPQAFPTGPLPYATAVADLNGDGQPDLVIAEQGSASVSVLLSTRVPVPVPASFAFPQAFGVSPEPYWVAVADFNGDGKPDLAVFSINGGVDIVTVLLNATAPGATAPSFAPQQTFDTGVFSGSMAVGDFNGDGKPDIAVAGVTDTGGLAMVLLNTTAPGATTPSFALSGAFPTGNFPSRIAVADFNGDGKPDLAIAAARSFTASVLLNTTPAGTTAPSFTPPQSLAVGDHARSVAVGDFNGDGKPDLAIPDYNTNTVSVLLNATPPGATTPAFAPEQAFPTGHFPWAVAVADLNGDGKADVVITNRNDGTVSVLRNTTPAGATIPSFAPQQTFAAIGFQSVTVGEFNEDGLPDLVVTGDDPPGGMSVLLNRTAPGATTLTLAPGQTFYAGGAPMGTAVGDFNGDGKADLAIAGNLSRGTVSVLLNTAIPIILNRDTAAGTISSAEEAPTSIVAVDGTTPQSAEVGTAFAVPPAVEVRDAAGNPVQGVRVTFKAPRHGPSGSFDGSTRLTVMTDADGQAAAPEFVAGMLAGDYTVTARAAGGSRPAVAFDLSNTPAAAVGLQVLAPAAVDSGMPFDVTVLAVDLYGNIDTNYTGTVHFSTADGAAGVVLPDDYTFQPGDAGHVTFAGGATLITPGDQVLSVGDVDSGIGGSATTAVTDGAGPHRPPSQGSKSAADAVAWGQAERQRRRPAERPPDAARMDDVAGWIGDPYPLRWDVSTL